jgi:hypothetical protein
LTAARRRLREPRKLSLELDQLLLAGNQHLLLPRKRLLALDQRAPHGRELPTPSGIGGTETTEREPAALELPLQPRPERRELALVLCRAQGRLLELALRPLDLGGGLGPDALALGPEGLGVGRVGHASIIRPSGSRSPARAAEKAREAAECPADEQPTADRDEEPGRDRQYQQDDPLRHEAVTVARRSDESLESARQSARPTLALAPAAREDGLVDDGQVDELRKWAVGLSADGRPEVRAAAKAILLLADDLIAARSQLLEERLIREALEAQQEDAGADVVRDLVGRLRRLIHRPGARHE